jgi:hypothetical protein
VRRRRRAAWLLPAVGIVVGAAALGYGAWAWSRNRESPPAPQPALQPDLDRLVDDELARFDG